MIINTNTWHYRVYQYWRGKIGLSPGQANLCAYFWTVMLWAPTLWLFLTIGKGIHKVAKPFSFLGKGKDVFAVLLLGALVILALGGAGVLVILTVLAFIENWLSALIVTGMIVGGLTGLFLAAVLLAAFTAWMEDSTKETKPLKLEVPGTIKLVWAYVTAKKRKVCPLIEFRE